MTTLFGYTLRFLRNRENLSAEALAKATGLGVTTIENIESGYIVPPDAVQEKLAGHFGVTVAYMKGSAEVWVPSVHAEEASVP